MATTSRVAVVTGGTGGIRRQVAERLLVQNYATVLNYVNDIDAAKASLDDLAGKGEQVIAHQSAIADEAQLRAPPPVCTAWEALLYTMSKKSPVEPLALLLARELRGRDIAVNTVAPGVIATDLLQKFLEGRPEARAELVTMSPIGRVGVPDDIAEVVTFLAGRAAG